MDLLDQVDLALNQITTYFESHVELEEEEVFLSLASFLDLDDLEDNRTLIEQAFEFDAPKFCDLIIWASKVDLFGLEAYYETPRHVTYCWLLL